MDWERVRESMRSENESEIKWDRWRGIVRERKFIQGRFAQRATE